MPRQRDFRFAPTKHLGAKPQLNYCEPLITPQMKASGSPFVVKIDEKKDCHPIYHLGKLYDSMILFKPASIMYTSFAPLFEIKD